MIPLVCYFYGMSLDQVGKLTIPQFDTLLSQITQIRRLFEGEGEGKESSARHAPVDWGLIRRSAMLNKARGIG